MNFIINKLIYWHINQLTKKIKADRVQGKEVSASTAQAVNKVSHMSICKQVKTSR